MFIAAISNNMPKNNCRNPGSRSEENVLVRTQLRFDPVLVVLGLAVDVGLVTDKFRGYLVT